MLSLWNSFEKDAAEASDEQNPVFRPTDDLWLKMVETTSEQDIGTLAFSQNVIEHILEAAEPSNTE